MKRDHKESMKESKLTLDDLRRAKRKFERASQDKTPARVWMNMKRSQKVSQTVAKKDTGRE